MTDLTGNYRIKPRRIGLFFRRELVVVQVEYMADRHCPIDCSVERYRSWRDADTEDLIGLMSLGVAAQLFERGLTRE